MQIYKHRAHKTGKKFKNFYPLSFVTLLLILGVVAVHATLAASAVPTITLAPISQASTNLANRHSSGTLTPLNAGGNSVASANGATAGAEVAAPKSSAGAAAATTSVIAPKTVAPAPLYNALYGLKFYYDTATDNAIAESKSWSSTRPSDAAQINKIAGTPRAIWLGDWLPDVQASTNAIVSAATAQGAVATLVAYDIPSRDCGNYSAGGASSQSSYLSWATGMANGISGRKTIVVLEPDALGLITCLSSADQEARYSMLSQAISLLSAKGALVYIDASTWVPASDMANRLNRAGVSKAQGFSLNVSGFQKTSDVASYANQLTGLVGGKHYIIDTSRNGLGSNGDWCNPSGRALGTKPQGYASGTLDAALWIKSPGESDGTCNGGPSAGTWWPEYALGLAQRASY
ncbi:glycoside hydrolase family 6 protein [Candidatus Saccharibacteria bacterium]|nr:glycoside hydrolase family 6 protein [Candidatus Saccharibacteria bacterium]